MTRDECTAEINSIVERLNADATFSRKYQLVEELKTLLKLRFSLIPKLEIFSLIANTLYFVFVNIVYKAATNKINKAKEKHNKAFAKDFLDTINGKF